VAYGLGAALGPMASGLSMAALGPAGLFQQSAVVMGGLAIFALYRLLARASPLRRPFVPKPAAQYSSNELYDAFQEQVEHDDTLPGAVKRK
jgi:hypothetical protein